MRLEKRNVYIYEFWEMSFKERYVYSIANRFVGCKLPEFNPLKWSIKSLNYMALFVIIMVLLPILCAIEAYALKNREMPESSDPEFKGGTNWQVVGKWVVVK